MSLGDLLVSWIWQGTAMAIGVRLALSVWPRLDPATRYGVWWIALGPVLVMPLSADLGVAGGASPELVGVSAVTTTPSIVLPAPPVSWVAYAVWGWAMAVVIGVARLGVELARLHRWKRATRPFPAAHAARLSLWSIRRRRARPMRLVISDDVPVASAFGFWDPVIVVPSSLAAVLSDDELDQVVAHEQAHLDRRDDWANLIQRIVAIVCGIHPAVWLINRELRRERELAADDRVVCRAGDSRRYAHVLGKVAESLAARTVSSVATAIGRPGQMARRIERLVRPGHHGGARPSRFVIGGCAAMATIMVGGLSTTGPAVAFMSPGDLAPAVRGVPGVPVWTRGFTAIPTASRTDAPAAMAVASLPAVAPLASAPRLPVFTGGMVRLDEEDRGADRRAAASGVPMTALASSATVHVSYLPESPAVALEVTRRGWGTVTDAGRQVGSWFSRGGQETARTFRGFGAALAGAFSEQ